MSDQLNISRGSAKNIVLEVLEVACSLAHMYKTWPTDCDKGFIQLCFIAYVELGASLGP